MSRKPVVKYKPKTNIGYSEISDTILKDMQNTIEVYTKYLSAFQNLFITDSKNDKKR